MCAKVTLDNNTDSPYTTPKLIKREKIITNVGLIL